MVERRPLPQPDLFGAPDSLPYVRGSDTSAAAAGSMAERAGAMEARVLEAIRDAGDSGVTVDELEVALDMLHQTCGARVRGLVLKGYVRDSGKRRNTRSGRKAAVWVATS